MSTKTCLVMQTERAAWPSDPLAWADRRPPREPKAGAAERGEVLKRDAGRRSSGRRTAASADHRRRPDAEHPPTSQGMLIPPGLVATQSWAEPASSSVLGG